MNFEGRFWQLDGVAMEPKPFQKPHPPLWFGGSAPAALRRAVRHGDGFFGAGSSTTEAFADQVSTVRAELDAQDRDPAAFRIAKRVYLAVDDDTDRARDRMAKGLKRIYGEFGTALMPVVVAGPPQVCVEGVQAVADAGAEMILLNCLFNHAEQMERLAADVMPFVS